MTRTIFYQISVIGLFVLFAACDSETMEDGLQGGEGFRSVKLQINEIDPASKLEAPLLVFRRAAETQDEYVLDSRFEAVAAGERLKLPLAELKSGDYRFLMIAQAAGATPLSIRRVDGDEVGPGTFWTDIRLACDTGIAAADGYGGFIDISGEALLMNGTVRLTLTRIAGRVLFDFYRMGGSPSRPESIVSEEVESVIDRVDRIDIVYENPTTVLRFDGSGHLVPDACASVPVVQSIRPALMDLKAVLPQTDKGLAVYDEALRGSLRMEGPFLLPSDSKLRIRLDFTYYDTTPVCGNDHEEVHGASCFPQRRLTLRLPFSGAAAGLAVAADTHTINRIGIRCDRIIDIPVKGGIEAGFDWQ